MQASKDRFWRNKAGEMIWHELHDDLIDVIVAHAFPWSLAVGRHDVYVP